MLTSKALSLTGIGSSEIPLDLSNVKERWEKQREAFSKEWLGIRMSNAKFLEWG